MIQIFKEVCLLRPKETLSIGGPAEKVYGTLTPAATIIEVTTTGSKFRARAPTESLPPARYVDSGHHEPPVVQETAALSTIAPNRAKLVIDLGSRDKGSE